MYKLYVKVESALEYWVEFQVHTVGVAVAQKTFHLIKGERI